VKHFSQRAQRLRSGRNVGPDKHDLNEPHPAPADPVDYQTFSLPISLTVLSSYKYLRSMIIDFFYRHPAKPVPGLNREPESSWTQKAVFLNAESSPA
jgi:hypothetical protein